MQLSRRMIAAFFCLAFSLFLPLSVHAESYTVTTTNDEADVSPSCVTGSSTDCSLREAIRVANTDGGSNNSDNDTITIPAGTYTLSVTGTGEDSSATGDLDITDTTGTTTLVGAGAGTTTIDANDIDRVMHTLSGTTSVISQLTLTNGTTTSSGAGIQALGTTTLDYVTVSNSAMTGSAFGGGVRCDSNTLVITNSTISGNTTSLTNAGAGINANLCNLTISDSTFTSNAAGSGGGAILASMGSNTILIEDSTFTTNSGTVGGAIYAFENTSNPSGRMTIQNSTFSENSATAHGGAIYFSTPLIAKNVTFIDNTAAGNGGAIFAVNDTDADLDMSFSSILQNIANSDRASGGSGGGLFVEGASADVVVKATIFGENRQYPDTPTGSSLSDCYASSGVTSANYNYLATTTDCTGIFTQPDDNTTSGSGSVFFTVGLEDHGGAVQTAGLWTSDTRNQIPSGDCTDIAGDPVSTDARGLARPQAGSCDMGAFESDETLPVVALTSGTDTIQCGVGSWSDAGATATDNFRTGLTASLSSGTVNTSVVGAYPILYVSSLDYDNNQGQNTRTVSVVDTTAPVITQTSAGDLSVTQGQTYVDPGATAVDACDSSVSVETTNPVNTAVPGVYTITYRAIDDSGNTRTATRTVTVTATVTQDSEPSTETDASTDDTLSSKEIVDVQKNGSSLLVTYSDNTSSIVSPYSTSKNFRHTMSIDKKRLIVTNGKDIRVFVNGERVTKKIIGTKTLTRANYRIAVKKIYNGYDSVFIATARQKTARVYALRLTTANTLTKQKSERFSINDLSKPTLSVNSTKKQVTVAYGKSGQRVKRTWKLQKDGDFSLVK